MCTRLAVSSFTTCSLLLLTFACSDEGGRGAAGTTSLNGSNVGSDDGGAPPPPSNDTEVDGSTAAAPAVPAVQWIGRFDETRKTAWPGGRIIARFEGTAVSATLTQIDGASGGNSWMNVVVDGVVTKKIEVSGTSQAISLASNLALGTHVIELEKRTEANRGTIVFEGFTFPDGGELLAPPARKTRRIEVLSDSTLDGFGSDGDLATTCAGGSPPALDNVRKSVAAVTSSLLDAEGHVVAYSGKGIVRNEPGVTGEPFPALYERTLPEDVGSAWDFTSWTPDIVVISLGGTDITSDVAPVGFQAGYDTLVTSIRAHYPDAHVYMTVWSQIKDLGAGHNVRTALKTVLDAIKAGHASDTKLHVFVWKEADHEEDETGCTQHANEAHGIETANELVPVIRADTGWN